MSTLEPESNQGQPESVRRQADADRNLETLFSDFISRFEELKRMNRESEESNAQLLISLKQANEKAVRIEQSLSTVSQLSRFATATAAQMLGRAAESVASMRQAAEVQVDARRDEIRKKALDLQREAIELMEEARDEAVRKHQESDQKALDILVKTKESIVAMAEDLGRMIPDSVPEEKPGAPVRSAMETLLRHASEAAREQDERTTSADAVETDAATGELAPPAEEAGQSSSSRSRVDDAVLSYPVESIELVASPFSSLSALSAFLDAVKGSSSAIEVKAHGFDRGRVRLAVRFAKPTPPAECLSALTGFKPRVVSAEAGRIELLVSENRSAQETPEGTGGQVGSDVTDH